MKQTLPKIFKLANFYYNTMRLLILDCKNFEYKLDHKTPVAEEVTEDLMQGKYDNPLVIFIAIEEKDNEEIIPRVADDIKGIARSNKSKLVIFNPFAHLSPSLAKAGKAKNLLNKLAEKLQECTHFKTIKSVFGWYKQFLVDVKGHGNSQLYREY